MRTLAYKEYRAERYFAPLDGIRAVAVLLVVLVHARGHGRWTWLAGWNGVTIFFVLSGFLITTLALREEDLRGRLDRGAFFLRRCFRILPLYLVALGLYGVLDLGLGAVSAPDRAHFQAALPFYLSPLPEIPHFFGHGGPFELAWSLGIEEKFYLAWPLLAFGLVSLRGRLGRRLALTCALAILLQAPLFFAHAGRALAPYTSILVGCGLAFLLHEPHWFRRSAALGRGAVLAVSLLFLVALQGLTALEPERLQGLYALAVGLVLGGVVIGRTALSRALATRPLRFTGRISYGLYLVHPLGLSAAAADVPARLGAGGDLLALIAGVAAAIAFAYVLHVTVERPLIALGRRAARSTGARKSVVGQVEPAPMRTY